MSFSVGPPRTVCSFVYDFIALEIMESVLTFHDDNFCKFHVLYTSTGDAWALGTRWRFVTERGKKKEPKFKSRPHCLGNNSNLPTIQSSAASSSNSLKLGPVPPNCQTEQRVVKRFLPKRTQSVEVHEVHQVKLICLCFVSTLFIQWCVASFN